MTHPIEYEMEARIKQAEFLKEAAQQRAVRIAQGDAERPALSWRAIGLPLAAAATIALVVLTSVRW